MRSVCATCVMSDEIDNDDDYDDDFSLITESRARLTRHADPVWRVHCR